MLRYSRLAAKPEVFRALTGLSIQEFESLLPSFNEAWEEFLKATFIDGVARQRAFGGGRIPRLQTGRAKLLFILFYLRIYPIQEVQGFFFGLSQEQANCWIHRLMPVLSRALGREALLPERRPARLEEVLRQYPALREHQALQEEVTAEDSSSEDSSSEEGSGEDSGSVLFIDGTERRIRRPSLGPWAAKDLLQRQQKGPHGQKRPPYRPGPTGAARQVLYLSRTCEGKRADKRIADEEEYSPPDAIVDKIYYALRYSTERSKVTSTPVVSRKSGKSALNRLRLERYLLFLSNRRCVREDTLPELPCRPKTSGLYELTKQENWREHIEGLRSKRRRR